MEPEREIYIDYYPSRRVHVSSSILAWGRVRSQNRTTVLQAVRSRYGLG